MVREKNMYRRMAYALIILSVLVIVMAPICYAQHPVALFGGSLYYPYGLYQPPLTVLGANGGWAGGSIPSLTSGGFGYGSWNMGRMGMVSNPGATLSYMRAGTSAPLFYPLGGMDIMTGLSAFGGFTPVTKLNVAGPDVSSGYGCLAGLAGLGSSAGLVVINATGLTALP
ncbi:MAG: hypothetical protein ACMUIS_08410 [bacterium]